MYLYLYIIIICYICVNEFKMTLRNIPQGQKQRYFDDLREVVVDCRTCEGTGELSLATDPTLSGPYVECDDCDGTRKTERCVVDISEDEEFELAQDGGSLFNKGLDFDIANNRSLAQVKQVNYLKNEILSGIEYFQSMIKNHLNLNATNSIHKIDIYQRCINRLMERYNRLSNQLMVVQVQNTVLTVNQEDVSNLYETSEAHCEKYPNGFHAQALKPVFDRVHEVV